MEQIEKSWYILGSGNNEILTFAYVHEDLKIITERANKLTNTCNYNTFRKYEQTERKYNKILLPFYNLNDVFINMFLLEFDFTNNLFYINGKKYKIEHDKEFTFKILKTKIKAIGGICGFYDFICKQLDRFSPYAFMLNDAFEKMLNK